VAVTSTGIDPRRCPHINLTGLEIQASGVESEDAARQRDLALVAHLKGKVAGLDFAGLSPRLGATWSTTAPEAMTFSYLGQEVVLAKSGIRIDGVEPEDPRDQILLYNYVHSGGGPEPTGDWLGLESLPNSISKVRTLATYSESPLAELFDGRDPAELLTAVVKAGGQPLASPTASACFVVQVLPRVPQQLLFWAAEPEDAFAARVKILFDRNVLTFLDVESLVFSAERLAERLRALLG